MPPALQNPITLWLLLTAALAGLVYAFMREELRVKAIAYGAFLLACAVAVWPPYEQDGHARQDPPRSRPARRHPPGAAGGGRRRAQRDRGRRGRHHARPGDAQGHPDRARPARVAQVLQRLGHRARAREGHARPAARLLPRRLGGARRGRGRLLGRDDRPLPAPAQGPDGAGGDPHAGAARERARCRRAADRRAGRARRPDPDPAAGRHRRRAGEAGDQDDRPALAQARRDVGRDQGDAAHRHRRPRAGEHGGGLGPRRHARASPSTTCCGARRSSPGAT